MSDEEDNEYPLMKYGTSLKEPDDPEEIAKKPIAIHEQIVTDEQGRRRFHGAFTGGFSAGYYNTVDTKDGWTPRTFRSSRSDRTNNKVLEPEDFMDEEDVSEYGIAPKRIVPQKSYSSSRDDKKPSDMTGQFAKNATMLLGVNMLQTLVIPVSNNIGIKLLQKMGWKPGQGIGPKVKKRREKDGEFTPQNMTFAPEDTVPVSFSVKDNTHGLGYSAMDPELALHTKIKKSSAISLTTKSGAKLSFAGQAFGVGAYEIEEEDIYSQDSMANYDFVMGEEKQDISYGWSKPTKAITNVKDRPAIAYVKKVLEGFKKAEKFVQRKMYPPPKLPQDFDPKKRLRLLEVSNRRLDSDKAEAERSRLENKFDRLNPDQRGNLLGEDLLKSEAMAKRSIFSFISPEDGQRLKNVKWNIGAPVVEEKPKKSGFYEPFASNSEKQSRYNQYLSALKDKKSLPYDHVQQDPNMTEWERHQEQEEFGKTSRFFQPLSATMSSRFAPESQELKEEDQKEEQLKKAAKMKLFGLMTRESVEWHPDALLCKRFNVPNPYPNSDIVGVPGQGGNPGSTEMFLHPDDVKKKSSKPQAIDSAPQGFGSKGGNGKILVDVKNPTMFREAKRSGNVSRWDKEPAVQGPSQRKNILKGSEEDSINVEDDHKQLYGEEKDSSNNEQLTTKERPSMDIFKAIFENSDEDSSDDEQEDDSDEAVESNATTKNDENFMRIAPQPDKISEIITKQKPSFQPSSSTNPVPRHVFSLKSQSLTKKKALPHNSSTMTHASSHSNADDTFGPALPPPSKISKLWKETDPNLLLDKLQKEKKKKHKKHKHKESKKSKKHKK